MLGGTTIYLKDAIDIMRREDLHGEGIPFDCSVRTFNKGTKKGGKLLSYNNAILLPLSSGKSRSNRESLKSLTHIPKAAKNPNHFDNNTRNIKTHSGLTRKIDLNYLITVNGMFISY